MSYRLRKISNSVYNMTRGGKVLTRVTFFKDKWIGRINQEDGTTLRAEHPHAAVEVFHDLVAQLNRISLGAAPDDAEGARRLLNQQNERVREKVAAFNRANPDRHMYVRNGRKFRL